MCVCVYKSLAREGGGGQLLAGAGNHRDQGSDLVGQGRVRG